MKNVTTLLKFIMSNLLISETAGVFLQYSIVLLFCTLFQPLEVASVAEWLR